MTIAPPRTVPSSAPAPASTPTVTAVLVVRDGTPWLARTLEALGQQHRLPDRLVVVDAGSTDGSADLLGSAEALGGAALPVAVLRADRSSTFGACVALAVAGLDDGGAPPSASDWLWLLHDDGAPAPLALHRLLDTARRSASVGIAGPKLTSWSDEGRLLEVGQQVSRTGRRAGGPVAGEPDQGQHDHRSDVLGVSSSGMLVRRDVFAALGGFEPAFAPYAEDLDLCWRAHLAGHRVVVVPEACVREAAASRTGVRVGATDPREARRGERRQARQVALTRGGLAGAPLLALWILLSGLASCLLLLVLKRPRRARAELADLEALLQPGRLIGAWWRARGQRQVRPRDLHGLFVPPHVAARATVDMLHDAVGSDRPVAIGHGPHATALETGPVADEAEDLTAPPATWVSRAARHPGLLAVLATLIVAVASWRGVLTAGGLTARDGLVGGELVGLSTDAAGLWHAYVDGWHGPGLGSSGESAPHLVVLAGLAWLVGRSPLVDPAGAPAAVAIGWLLLAAMPLSAASAYIGGRAVTAARWPRAWAALGWGTLATLTAAVGTGRLGAVVAHLLLPLVLLGYARVATRRAGTSGTVATALAVAALGAFSAPLMVLALLVALVLLVRGPGPVRVRALVLSVIPLALLGPWVTSVLGDWRLLLSGPGLAVRGGTPPAPWQLALLHPDGPASWTVLLSVPVLLAGVVAMARRGRASTAMTALAVLGLTGLGLGLLAPRLVLATTATGLPGGGAAVTAWAGTGLDVWGLSLLFAALLGVEGLSRRQPSSVWAGLRPLTVALVTAAALGVLATAGLAGWNRLPTALRPQRDTVPAVVADQATGPLAARMLVLSGNGTPVRYRVVGREPGPVVRPLPTSAQVGDPELQAAVQATVTSTSAANANLAWTRLADLGVGFVALEGRPDPDRLLHLDATAGLTRLGDRRDLILWRVLPRPGVGAGITVPSARARLQTPDGRLLQPVDVAGDHVRAAVHLPASGAGRLLVVAEPQGWVEHARVRYAGRQLAAVPGRSQPTYALPGTAGRLDIDILPTWSWWRWGQAVLLGLVVFLALPFGHRRSRRAS
jgi:GT2 family glycosyltransferase